MSVRLEFDRIPPGVEIGPHRHGVETVLYLAGGELVFEHGDDLDRRIRIDAGDVLYEASGEFHLVRNEGQIDALALVASEESPDEPDAAPRRREDPAEPIRRADEARVMAEPGVTRRLLAMPGDFSTTAFSVSEVEVEPGASVDWHRHPSSEHAIVVFEGRGTIAVGDIRETLEPLKGIRVEAGLPHHIRNTGRTRLRYYVCGTPATNLLHDREAANAPNRDRSD